jgi:hypothetical protein
MVRDRDRTRCWLFASLLQTFSVIIFEIHFPAGSTDTAKASV